ncbi:phosphatidylglycerophosphatase A [Bryobacterales bacterium F-183]|nr:phosphatidylglycerophosphatase A [Bryobacterales bacterium F-183]
MSKAGVAELIATWFGCGYAPFGPGTFGSLGALIPAFIACTYFGASPSLFAILGLLVLFPGIWASSVTAVARNLKDPQIVVVDEVSGQWVTMAGMLGVAVVTWKAWLAAFVLFRLFDIVKPWPVRQFEALPGGAGIMADDVMAGVYGALVLYGLGWFNLI